MEDRQKCFSRIAANVSVVAAIAWRIVMLRGQSVAGVSPAGDQPFQDTWCHVAVSTQSVISQVTRQGVFRTIVENFLLHRGVGGLRWPSRSNARASGPLWLRNDVKRSGNRLVAGSFDRFVNYAHRLER